MCIVLLPKSSARNLGVTFDECCNMEGHVKKIYKTSYYHLMNISKIRKYSTSLRKLRKFSFMCLLVQN